MGCDVWAVGELAYMLVMEEKPFRTAREKDASRAMLGAGPLHAAVSSSQWSSVPPAVQDSTSSLMKEAEFTKADVESQLGSKSNSCFSNPAIQNSGSGLQQTLQHPWLLSAQAGSSPSSSSSGQRCRHPVANSHGFSCSFCVSQKALERLFLITVN